MDAGSTLALATDKAGAGAAGEFESGIHHGHPMWCNIEKRSHFEMNGIEVENVPRYGERRGRVWVRWESFWGGFHHRNPVWGVQIAERSQFEVKGHGMNRLQECGRGL